MKKTLLLISLSLSLSSYAGPIDSPEAAILVKEQLQQDVLAMVGVIGIGVTGCRPDTGEMDLSGDFVHCVAIMTENELATEEVLKLFPAGSKYDNVFMVVDQTGPIEIEPRGSAGN